MPATLFHKITESFAGSLYVGQSEANLLYLEQVALRSTTPAHVVEPMVRVLDDMRYLSGNTVAAPSHVVRFMGQIGIVSPFFEAVPLRLLQLAAREKKMPFPVSVATKIALDVFDGLCQYHALDTKLYGGVCPDHLLVGTDGDTRVANIPISAITPKESPWRGRVERLAYLAPEQVTASYNCDARTDVYAIGVILWEMIADQSRLTGTPLQILETLRTAKESPNLSPIDESKVSNGLLQALTSALHPDPDRRQPSIGAFALDLLEADEQPAEASEVAEFVEQIAKETLQQLRTAVTLQQIEAIKQSRAPKTNSSSVRTVEAEQLLASVRESRPASVPPPNVDHTAVFNVTAELLQKARRGPQPPPKPASLVPDAPLGSDKTVIFEVPDDLLEEARRLFTATESARFVDQDPDAEAPPSARISQSAPTARPPAASTARPPAASTARPPAASTARPPAASTARPPATARPIASTARPPASSPLPPEAAQVTGELERPTTDQKRAEELLRKLRSDGPGLVQSSLPAPAKVEDDVTTIWRPEMQNVTPISQTGRAQDRPTVRQEAISNGLTRTGVAPNRLGYWILGLFVSIVVGVITVFASRFLGH